MSDPRTELNELSAALRKHLDHEARKGRSRIRVPDAAALPDLYGPRRRPDSDPDRKVHPGQPGEPVPPKAAQTKPVAKGKAAAGQKPTAKAPAPATAATAPAKSAAGSKKLPRIEIEPEAPDYAERMTTLAALAQEASICEKCGLCASRTNVVFARGKARNRVMFIGEAPGADEDAQGYPFVGRAGKLLDQIIDAIGFDRDEIYVANILKCRPPQNRDPRPEEIIQCTPYLEEQIRLVDPKIICALGKFASQFLTGKPKATMGQLRGRIHYYQDRIMVLPTYHPAALLRNPHWKRVVWEDVQVLRKEYLR